MAEPIRILMVEDVPTDAELAEREICKILPDAVFRLVETEGTYLHALEQFQPDLIISDYSMPSFDGMTALTLAKERAFGTPVIILTGSMNEDTAVACMKAGAADYVIKEHTKRLGPAVVSALEQKRNRNEKEQAQKAFLESVERLHRAVGAIIQTVAMTVEMRDPYTSGHQHRVACLAHAIGNSMVLPADRIEGLRMAAMIHDLGKVSVPAEILSKPTKLTALEFALIKTHATTGFNILKDIEFPWPIAEIVYQHHERIDGSGYPRGLKGEELLLEARILNVADVVEAMSSHRPYRPGLGLEAALGEIENNKGVLYDPDCSVACLQLFREGRFKWEEQ